MHMLVYHLQVSSLTFDVLLTTYDIALLDQDFLAQIPWHYVVVDEAQRLKNPSSVCLFYLYSLFGLLTTLYIFSLFELVS